MKLWIVGKVLNPEEGGDRWEFAGVFDDEKKAVAACKEKNFFCWPCGIKLCGARRYSNQMAKRILSVAGEEKRIREYNSMAEYVAFNHRTEVRFLVLP